ncbi:MAG: hypothetical protein ISP01_08615 [Methanobrevibacter arboriphilus]|uniref:Uncharacterized protein n=1 Tax=Methanobrevibacter arboriphilus TaxID=39441 RepID=A0A843AQE1_METAZ|nr:hypothetical protein [Methanobrevibacter arboriphilus]MBF4469449.1 hypothetical protein [Methanobrevibacter arboriphilus]
MDKDKAYFRLEMTKEKRNKIKSEAASRGKTMQEFIHECIDKCCNKKE